MNTVVGLVLFLLVVYVAYKLGKFILKVALGLAVMALIAWFAWQWFGGSQMDTPNISQITNRVEEVFQSLTSSPQGRELAQAMRDFSAQAGKIGREKVAEFREKQLPAIKEKARRYKEELDRQGKLKEAQEFWERFTRWLEDFAHETPLPR